MFQAIDDCCLGRLNEAQDCLYTVKFNYNSCTYKYFNEHVCTGQNDNKISKIRSKCCITAVLQL
jgi:hypothetical protein